mgnify:CR=1 FL=1
MIRRPHRGFALFELLVAMAIFSVLAALAYGGLSSVARTRGELEASGARLKALQLGVAQIGRQLRQAAVRPVRGSYGESLPALGPIRAGPSGGTPHGRSVALRAAGSPAPR